MAKVKGIWEDNTNAPFFFAEKSGNYEILTETTF